MVGVDVAVEVGERQLGDVLVGEADALQHRHHGLGRPAVEERELHVGQDERMVALCDQQRGARVERRRLERTAVDDAGARRERVDPDAGPRGVGERQPGDHPQRDPAVTFGIVEQLDRALGHGRVPGDRVHDLAVLRRGTDERLDDRGVTRIELGRGVVLVVERREHDTFRGELGDRRMPRRPCEAERLRVEGGTRRGHEQIDPARPEPDDDDPARLPHAANPSVRGPAASPARPGSAPRRRARCSDPTSRSAGSPRRPRRGPGRAQSGSRPARPATPEAGR